jgi:putative ABC transport system ATP-binding protein
MPADGAPVILRARAVHKSYRLGQVRVEALRGVDLAVAKGELVAVVGPSGSGKSTLLNLLGILDRPDSGQVLFEEADVATLTEAGRTKLRRRHLGFVFQSFNLIPVLSAYENVEYPLWLDGTPPLDRTRRVRAALELVGLGDRLRHRPDELSGGERQRVSLARALVHDPSIVLADEPTASLDSKTGLAVIDLFRQLNLERGTTFLLATHDPLIVARAGRALRIADGLLVEDHSPGLTARP